ncbi:polysaccharide biosynthesis protein [Aeromicrobium marinum DSM 15272]|uniref:Polysaccharide biosynthesis protein n=1 Tax=Aeromicrobium marinum DSM 15272 TaxID=585531 RepID=E2SAE8_9ACTN|nr:hypothetical protein [Aeromicrobium marinum]EFQ84222.1 polysaccharide biosynthesis protein [Aeromicrobium marinum DSM 15272]
MRLVRQLLSSGTLVATGMIGMNVAVYGFTLAGARLLDVSDLGALTALLAVLLVGTVVSLALQASSARRLAVAGGDTSVVVGGVARVAVVLAVLTGLGVGLVTLALTPALRLDSVWPALMCGAALVPLTLMGAQMGIAQGSERWGMLTVVYLTGGLGRLVGGVGALLVDPSVTAAMTGVALGAWLPLLAAGSLLRGGSTGRTDHRPFLRETLLAAQALLAYFVLSNLDAIVARTILEREDSGLYAAGVILAKAALFFPQFISVVVYPALARATTTRARWVAVGLVAGLGALATLATALLPRLALVLVGGDRYEAVADRLWLFALAGSCLAVVHLLVFDALARHAHGISLPVWAAVAVILVVAYGTGVGLNGLVVTVAVVAAALATFLLLAPSRTSTPAPVQQ